uniref:Uncharacterized protein n=1 Tax=Trypanosoma congolense (strain IL3000) TaxID=1068625 RepID=G0V246_TRYCI|nr:hypothetical protein, unlikely [Trypanosoma congolense IL3000]
MDMTACFLFPSYFLLSTLFMCLTVVGYGFLASCRHLFLPLLASHCGEWSAPSCEWGALRASDDSLSCRSRLKAGVTEARQMLLWNCVFFFQKNGAGRSKLDGVGPYIHIHIHIHTHTHAYTSVCVYVQLQVCQFY